MTVSDDKQRHGGRGFDRGALWAATALSVVIHLVALAVVRFPGTPTSSEKSEKEEKRELTVDYVPVAEAPEPPEKQEERDEKSSEEAAKAETPDSEPKERKQPEDEKEPEQKEDQKPPDQQLRRKAVVQETNEAQPEQAKFVSEKANRVEEETRARETTQEYVEPESESGAKREEDVEDPEKVASKKPAPKAGAQSSRKPRRPTPRQERTEKDREESEKSDESEAKPERDRGKEKPETKPEREGPQPGEEATESKPSRESDEGQEGPPDEPLPTPTVGDYEKLFAGEEKKVVEEHRRRGEGSEMMKRIEESEGSVQAAVENYIPEVKPGNHTSVNAKSDVAATYINKIHSKIHPRWGGGFLMELESSYGPGHPLSDPSLNAELELVVDGATGKLEEVTIVRSSGRMVYDMEAIEIVREVAPNPEAPDPIVSLDGNVYLHWNFWRNQRQCGTFGVSIYKKTEGADGQPEKKKR